MESNRPPHRDEHDDVEPRTGHRHNREHPPRLELRTQWEANAPAWIDWARQPHHDSYWRFHRDQFLTLLPAPGERTLDLGCGEGRLTRDLRSLGHAVVGIDVSTTLVSAAHDLDPSTHLVVSDAAVLPLRDAVFDLAIAFMTLQDVDDLQGAARETARVLKPGGRLCLAIVHPLNSAGTFATDEPDSDFVVSGSYLDGRYYLDEVERDGLMMRFASAHRPLEAYFAALSSAGLLVEDLREPGVPDHAFDSPRGDRWRRIPLFLHLRAVRF